MAADGCAHHATTNPYPHIAALVGTLLMITSPSEGEESGGATTTATTLVW
jgi:hypothetical protein